MRWPNRTTDWIRTSNSVTIFKNVLDAALQSNSHSQIIALISAAVLYIFSALNLYVLLCFNEPAKKTTATSSQKTPRVAQETKMEEAVAWKNRLSHVDHASPQDILKQASRWSELKTGKVLSKKKLIFSFHAAEMSLLRCNTVKARFAVVVKRLH